MKHILIFLLSFNLATSQDYYLDKSNNDLGGTKDHGQGNQNGNGNGGNGNHYGWEAPQASIDGYIGFVALIGALYVFKKIKK